MYAFIAVSTMSMACITVESYIHRNADEAIASTIRTDRSTTFRRASSGRPFPT
jgi:hypothetical protein